MVGPTLKAPLEFQFSFRREPADRESRLNSDERSKDPNQLLFNHIVATGQQAANALGPLFVVSPELYPPWEERISASRPKLVRHPTVVLSACSGDTIPECFIVRRVPPGIGSKR